MTLTQQMSDGPSPAGRRNLREISRYLVIGVASVALDVGLLVLLHERAGLGLGPAASIAFGTSLLFNFLLNRLSMAGGADTRHLGRQAFRYAVLVLVNYGVTLLCLTVAAQAGQSYVLAKLLVVGCSTVWNYVLYRRWVFLPPPSASQPAVDHRATAEDPAGTAGAHASEPLLVVIPAYNEEDCLAGVVQEVRAELPEAAVLVVDDASRDATRQVALRAGAEVLTLPYNLGVGGAMRAGFRYALRHGFRAVLQVDADGQHDPRDARLLLAGLDDADVVIGARFAGVGSYRVRGPRRWAMRVLSGTLSRMAGTELTDTTSGFRASGPRAVEIFARHYPAEYLGDTVESIVISCRHGLRVRQVPAHLRDRRGGRPSQSPLRASVYLVRACLALCLAGVRWRQLPPALGAQPARTAPRAPVPVSDLA